MLNFPAIKTKLDSQYNISPSQKTILEWNYNATSVINPNAESAIEPLS